VTEDNRRKEFEAYLIANEQDLTRDAFKRDERGEYINSFIAQSFRAWKAGIEFARIKEAKEEFVEDILRVCKKHNLIIESKSVVNGKLVISEVTAHTVDEIRFAQWDVDDGYKNYGYDWSK